MTMEYDPILYESDPRSFLKEEVDFYINLCAEFRPKTILELGVGTGRIFSKLLPEVEYAVGLDISNSMLEVCNKISKPNKNYKLYEGSFVNFDLNTVFDLIYIPFNTFQHLLLEEDQVSCLKSIRKHMDSNSKFILDVMNSENLTFTFGEWHKDYSSPLPDGRIIERYQQTTSVNNDTFVTEKIFMFKEILKDKTEQVKKFKASMKINPNKKMKELLFKNGFVIENIWSDYFFNSGNDTKKVIYCLKKHGI